MIIGVDGVEANVQSRVGVSVYTVNLLKYFRKNAHESMRFKIFLKSPPLPDMPKNNHYFTYEIVPGPIAWSQIFLPIRLFMQKDIDVFFSPAHYAPRFCPVPSVVTVHDLSYLYYPEDFLKEDLFKLKNWTEYSIKKAIRIVAVSKTTKNDIVKNYNLSGEKVFVVYNGFEKRGDLKESKFKMRKLSKPFFLYVGTLQPRKNIPALIQAFSDFKKNNPEFELIIAGKKGWLFDRIFEKVSALGLNKDVFFTDYITDQQLIFLYKNAFALVLPSFYEGFGLPVLEAMSYGCPVISSFASSLPEIGADAALYFDPSDIKSLTEKMQELKDNIHLRKDLIQKGKERVKSFSWQECGKQTLAVIQSVV